MFEFKRPIFIIRDPKLVKKLSIKDFDNFVDHRVLVDEHSDKMFGKSLISLKGQKWRGNNMKLLLKQKLSQHVTS